MKKRWGDRWDAKLVRELDGMHFVMGVIWPNRTDNEAFMSEVIDLTNINEYLKKKNADNPEYKYNLFQCLITAICKTITLRSKLNRFIANGNYYQRNDISAAFIVKKQFKDEAGEGMAVFHTRPENTIEDIHEYVRKQVTTCRSEKVDPSQNIMNIFSKIPRGLSKAGIHFVMWLEKHGWTPKSLHASDPWYASCFLTNLGSIGLHGGYHHLSNWGTNSMFCVVGQIKDRPFYDEQGNMTMRPSVDIGITLDERIADGYYFAKSLKLIKKLMENPELLETRLDEEVDY